MSYDRLKDNVICQRSVIMTSKEKQLESELVTKETLSDEVLETTLENEQALENETTNSKKVLSDEDRPNFLKKIKNVQKTLIQNLKPNELENEAVLKEIDEETERLKAEKEEKIIETSTEEIADEKDEMITTCEALRALKDHLQAAPAHLLKKDYVLVHRNETLTLVNTLVSLCNEDPLDSALIGDGLINKLSGCANNESTDEPLTLVKKRVQTILNDAMTQADLIVNDAKILSHQLLSNTEKKIQTRYDEAEAEINARMALTREESSKKLTEAKDSLSQARQQSEEILKKYLDKAEDDYKGYWERAEKHLEVSHTKSLNILNKALDIYKKELNAIKEDMMTLEDILRELEANRPKGY